MVAESLRGQQDIRLSLLVLFRLPARAAGKTQQRPPDQSRAVFEPSMPTRRDHFLNDLRDRRDKILPQRLEEVRKWASSSRSGVIYRGENQHALLRSLADQSVDRTLDISPPASLLESDAETPDE